METEPRPYRPAVEWLLIALFAAALVAPTIAESMKSEAQREAEIEHEWRRPAPFPALTARRADLVAFPEAYERWLNDHFGFRTTLIRWHNALRMFGLHTDPNERVTMGPWGWLFIGSPQYVGYHRAIEPFTTAELEEWREALEARRDFCAAHGAKYLFFLAPSKSTIYPEEMPERYARVGEETRADQLYEYMREHSDVPMLDLRPALLAAKEHEVLYYPLGSHWNDRGAFVAYTAILEALQPWFDRMEPRPRSAFRERPAPDQGDSWAGKLHLGDLLRQESIQLEPIQNVPLPRGKYPDLQGNHFFVQTQNEWRPRMVMFRDSMASALVDLLAPHFSRSAFFWDRRMVRPYVEREHPDLVLQELVERDLSIWSPTRAREPR